MNSYATVQKYFNLWQYITIVQKYFNLYIHVYMNTLSTEKFPSPNLDSCDWDMDWPGRPRTQPRSGGLYLSSTPVAPHPLAPTARSKFRRLHRFHHRVKDSHTLLKICIYTTKYAKINHVLLLHESCALKCSLSFTWNNSVLWKYKPVWSNFP